jgi:5-methylcytosine-specific restriction enzyme A
MKSKSPFVWEMIHEAVEHSGTEIMTYQSIRDYVLKKWPGTNTRTILAQTIILTVNHTSRHHYPENSKPRLTNTGSKYDFLFRVGKGIVTKYDIEKHGVWEIKLVDGKISNNFVLAENKQLYSACDIQWFKNVNHEGKGAYMNVGKEFDLHFKDKNADSPKIGEIIVLYQKIDNIRCLTHLVSPIEDSSKYEAANKDYPYTRLVKTIAKCEPDTVIDIKGTDWQKVRMGGIAQGPACPLATANGVDDFEELQLETWALFEDYFDPNFQSSVEAHAKLMDLVDFEYPDLSVKEGKLYLVSHLARERNRKIVEAKKAHALKFNILFCEVCGFSFQEKYQKSYIECHHIKHIAETDGEIETQLSDLALVCSNCHRMLHQKFDGKFLTIDELKERLND